MSPLNIQTTEIFCCRTVKESSIIAVQIFERCRRPLKKEDRKLLSTANIQINEFLNLELGEQSELKTLISSLKGANSISHRIAYAGSTEVRSPQNQEIYSWQAHHVSNDVGAYDQCQHHRLCCNSKFDLFWYCYAP